jgi:hypothetical protein
LLLFYLTLKHLDRNAEIDGSVSKSLPNVLATARPSNGEMKIVKTTNSPESSENENDASVVARNNFWEIEDADAPTGWSSVFFMFL